jgi:hypothetical protein
MKATFSSAVNMDRVFSLTVKFGTMEKRIIYHLFSSLQLHADNAII